MTWHSRTRRAIRHLFGAGARAQLRAFDGSGAPSDGSNGGLGSGFRNGTSDHHWFRKGTSGTHSGFPALAGKFRNGSSGLDQAPALDRYGCTAACRAVDSPIPSAPRFFSRKRIERFAGEGGMGPAGRLFRVTLLAPAVATAALLVGATPALAVNSHAFAGSFGSSSSSPADPYPLSSPSAVAVDQASGATYVADPGNDWVEKFDSSGHLVWIIGKEVDQTTGGNLCTVASGDTCQPGTPGTGPGQFTTPTYVAVDNSTGATQGTVRRRFRGQPGAAVQFRGGAGLLMGRWWRLNVRVGERGAVRSVRDLADRRAIRSARRNDRRFDGRPVGV